MCGGEGEISPWDPLYAKAVRRKDGRGHRVGDSEFGARG